MMKRPTPLLALVQSYFQVHLRRVRGVSEHTIRAYRDGLRLFFLFAAQKLGRSVAELSLDDLRTDLVLAFLDHLESARANSPVTRN
ncbi:MAG: integrase, partial [Acidobacteria bacterium 37-65-4]